MSIESINQEIKSIVESTSFAGTYKAIELIDDLCALMQEKNISNAELARLLGVSRARVTSIFNNQENITIKTAAEIAKVLGTEIKFRFEPTYRVERICVTTDSPKPQNLASFAKGVSETVSNYGIGA